MLRLETADVSAELNTNSEDELIKNNDLINQLQIKHKKQKDDDKNKRKKDEFSSDEDENQYHKNVNSDNENEDDYEKDLESLVFGSESVLFENIDKKIAKNKKKLKNEDKSGKVELAEELIERKPAWQDENDNEMVDLNKYNQFSNIVNTKSNKVTASEIEESLKARFAKYYGTPMWADLDFNKKKKSKKVKKAKLNLNGNEREETDSEDDENEDDEETSAFQETGNFLADSKNNKSSLPKNILDIKACTDANKEDPDQTRLKTVEFHPTARVMLTAGLSHKLSLFQIDGKKNSKIQTIFIESFPILSAHFTRSGDEIIMGSKHKSFYYFDMHTGKTASVTPPVKALDEYQRSSMSANFEISPDNRFIAFVGTQGQIHLFSVKSKEWMDTVKINGTCNAITFSPDGRYLFAFGDDKDVYIFDMNDRGHRSLNKFTDYGCLSGTSIAVSNNSQYIATGCKSGVVNIYNLNDALQHRNETSSSSSLNKKISPTASHLKPIKSFMNLTTPCSSLKFNSTSEILAASSAYAENAIKLIHVGSMSVFSNFPLQQQMHQIRIVESVDFSLNSGYFTIGNHKGNALLYRLKHYGSF